MLIADPFLGFSRDEGRRAARSRHRGYAGVTCGVSATGIRGRPDAVRARCPEDPSMQRSYGVVWRKGSGPLAAGKLELLPQGVRLEGLEGSFEIAYESLSGVRVGRATEERIDGRPSVVLERLAGIPLRSPPWRSPAWSRDCGAPRGHAAGRGGPAPARADRAAQARRVRRVRDLFAQGPPFDPEQIRGSTEHEVFMVERRRDLRLRLRRRSAEALAPLLSVTSFWQAAVSWREHIAAPPRVAEGSTPGTVSRSRRSFRSCRRRAPATATAATSTRSRSAVARRSRAR